MSALRTRTERGLEGAARRRGKRREGRLKEQKSRRRTGTGVARRNSSLVKGAIIQGIAPGPQTAHKLWAFNFAILTGRSGRMARRARFLELRATLRPTLLPFSPLLRREEPPALLLQLFCKSRSS